MRNRFFTVFALGAFLLGAVGAAVAQTKANLQTAAAQNGSLAAQLPASDAVLTLDVQRLLNEAVPQVLAGKPQMLAGINGSIDNLRDKTGLDARQFEQIAVGVRMKTVSAREVDLEPVFLARGKTSANALIAVAKLAANGKYREEKSGSRTIYVFSGKDIAAQNKPSAKNSWFDRALDRMINGLSREVAVVSLDANTLAFGSLARVRETVEGKSAIDSEVLGLAARRPNAVLSFGANLPSGLSNFIDLPNDELGTTLDRIRQMSGAVEVAGGTAALSVAARTARPDEAKNLKDTLEGLQTLGKALLLGGKSEQNKVYGRMIENARLAQTGNEVTLDLQVAQTDINILLGDLK